MKSKLMTSLILAAQIVTVSSAFAKTPPINTDPAVINAVKLRLDRSEQDKNKAVHAGITSGVSLGVAAFTTAVRRTLSVSWTDRGWTKLKSPPGKFELAAYTVFALAALKGTYDAGASTYQNHKAFSTSVDKNLPAAIMQGQEVLPADASGSTTPK